MDISLLIKKIGSSFNLDELKTLCLEIGLDFENLPGENTRVSKSRELVQYCRRQNILPELIEKCTESRPNVDWLEVFTTTEKILSSPESSIGKLTNPEIQPEDGIEKVEQGLDLDFHKQSKGAKNITYPTPAKQLIGCIAGIGIFIIVLIVFIAIIKLIAETSNGSISQYTSNIPLDDSNFETGFALGIVFLTALLLYYTKLINPLLKKIAAFFSPIQKVPTKKPFDQEK